MYTNSITLNTLVTLLTHHSPRLWILAPRTEYPIPASFPASCNCIAYPTTMLLWFGLREAGIALKIRQIRERPDIREWRLKPKVRDSHFPSYETFQIPDAYRQRRTRKTQNWGSSASLGHWKRSGVATDDLRIQARTLACKHSSAHGPPLR